MEIEIIDAKEQWHLSRSYRSYRNQNKISFSNSEILILFLSFSQFCLCEEATQKILPKYWLQQEISDHMVTKQQLKDHLTQRNNYFHCDSRGHLEHFTC